MYEPHRICRTAEVASAGLFKGLGRQESEAIRNAAVVRTFRTSEIIVNAEELARHFFLMTGGSVDFYVLTSEGREILLRRLVPGDLFGVVTLLSEPMGYFGTAKSVRDSEILVWEHGVIRQLGTKYPHLVENALRTVLHYVALYAKRHIALVSNTAQQRVAWVLTNLASRAGHLSPGGLEVEVKNEDLASLADVNFFTVSRILKQWDRDGAVTKTRGKIVIRSPEHLLAA
jgi:CRP-like cAMP-binding protein